MMSEKLCLQWNDFKDSVTSAFASLREDKDFADVTLVCEDGQQLKVHKVILAASSPFFQNLLRQNLHPHPLIYMRGVKSMDLVAIVDFLYVGETNVCQDNLDSFLAIAEELQLKGLMGQTNDDEVDKEEHLVTPVTQEATQVFKKEANISKVFGQSKSKINKQTNGKSFDAEAGTLALMGQFSGDLQDLHEKASSMMEKLQQRMQLERQYLSAECAEKRRPSLVT